MSVLNDALVAPLVRGLFLDATKGPVIVVPSDAAGATGPHNVDAAHNVTAAPAATARYSLALPDSVLGAEGALDEAAAAAALKAAFGSSMAAGAKAALPSLVEVSLGGERRSYLISGPESIPGIPPAALAGAAASRSADPAAANSALGRAAVVAGKVALVTGGAQGFGAEIVRGLAASGAFVYIADMNLEGAERLADELNAASGGRRASAVSVNVSDEASVAAMFDRIAASTGGLDLIVSNAGIVRAGSVLEQDEKSFRLVTDVNYVAFFLVAKHGGRLLARQRRTAPRWLTDIVQINSKSGLEGSNKNGAYAGSKFGGLGLVQSFALELIAHGIKVNAICPGNFLDGPLWSDPVKGLFVQYLNSGKVPGAKSVADVRAFYEAKVPMGRGATGADVMRALYYVVEQEYETGQALPVAGGQVMLN